MRGVAGLSTWHMPPHDGLAVHGLGVGVVPGSSPLALLYSLVGTVLHIHGPAHHPAPTRSPVTPPPHLPTCPGSRQQPWLLAAQLSPGIPRPPGSFLAASEKSSEIFHHLKRRFISITCLHSKRRGKRPKWCFIKGID